MGLTADISTDRRSGKVVSVPLEAGARVYAGGLVARNAAGYGVPAADAVGLRVIGIAERGVDNTAGIRGGARVDVERAVALLPNSAAHPLTIANCETPVFVEDDGTVAATGGTNNIVAGRLVELDPNNAGYAWVDTARAN